MINSGVRRHPTISVTMLITKTLKTFNRAFVLLTLITMLTKMVGYRVEAEQYEALKKIADAHQVKVATVTRWAVTAYLKDDHVRSQI